MRRFWITQLSFGFLIFAIHAQDSLNMKMLARISHPELTNDIWGYVDSTGTEYAIVGTRSAARIYSLEDPESPRLRATIPGVSSIWRDFKSYGKFIYGTSDQGADGLAIIDMSSAPDSFRVFHWKNEIEIKGLKEVLKTCHNLYIDTSGYAYLAGCNPGTGGVIILDLKKDPLNPVVVGVEDEKYAHDVIVKDSFLYASEIYEGHLAIYSIADRGHPRLISRSSTSGLFTHNAWPSDDGKYIFTTDERANAYVDAYDIRNPENPVFLDKFQPVPNSNIIPHNTHYINGYLVTSWYTEGVIIVDASEPDNLIKVAQYDTNPQNHDGCWGVYPFLPSGLILASDMDNGFFVLKADYKRARHFDGLVVDKESRLPINAVKVTLPGIPNQEEISNAFGEFRIGTVDTGRLRIYFNHPSYYPDSIEIESTNASASNLEIQLRPRKMHSLTIRVENSAGEVIQNAKSLVISSEGREELSLGAIGLVSKNFLEGPVNILTAAWGYRGRQSQLVLNNSTTLKVVLESGYEDDFFVDLGWTSMSTASSGYWTRAVPKGTFLNGRASNPGEDIPTDLGDYCFVTGNINVSVGADDVDDGSVTLLSPGFNLSEYTDPVIVFQPWFVNGGGSSTPNDSMHVVLRRAGAEKRILSLSDIETNHPFWRDSIQIRVSDYFQSFDSLQFSLVVSDDSQNPHIVEGGIDGFRIIDNNNTTDVHDLSNDNIFIFPNPSSDKIEIHSNKTLKHIEFRDLNGRLLQSILPKNQQMDVSKLPTGLVIVQVYFADGTKKSYKLIRI